MQIESKSVSGGVQSITRTRHFRRFDGVLLIALLVLGTIYVSQT